MVHTTVRMTESICSLLQLLCNDDVDENIALRWKTTQSLLTVTYREVNVLANKIQRLLCDNSVCSELFIGIHMEPGIAFPSTILGILKHGAAFVCLDHKEESRPWNKYVCDILGIQWVFTNNNSGNDTQQKVIASINCYGDVIYLIQRQSDCKDTSSVREKNIAYACGTSGSTGDPKIVQVPHSSIIPNITHLRSKFQITPRDVIFQAAPPTFDPCVVEIFLALSSGASLLMVPSTTKSSPNLLADALSCEPRPTVIQATPSLITSLGLNRIQTLLLSNDCPVRVVALGGEQCPSKSLLSKWRSPENKTSIFNLYGVTEVSCWSTCHGINLSSDNTEERIPLGEPFPYTQLQVRDRKGNILKEGQGELFISNGDRMCVVEGQVLDSEGTRWCASGDLVELCSDGTMYFCGRQADSRTIKRWGHRVSLNFIETCVLTSGLVETCHAISAVTKSLQLVLFVVLSESSRDVTDITKHLRKNMLSVAQPEAIIKIPALPLTTHGKIDKRKLKTLAKEWENSEINRCWKNKREFHNIKDIVKDAWSSVLGLDSDFEINDNASFLASGGDSALAALLAADLLRFVGKPDDLSLLTTILEESFSDVCYKVFDLSNVDVPPKSENVAVKRPYVDSIEVPIVDIAAGSCHVWRSAEPQNDYPRLICALSKGNSQYPQTEYYHKLRNKEEVAIELFWKCEMAKCVDASPLVLQYDNGSCLAVIGSHSGRVVCVEIESSEKRWSLELHDRIESSATASPCGQFICLGCYDGRLYCIEISSGICCWAYQSEAMIKGSAVFYKSRVIFGSYDQSIYCLNMKDGTLLWRNNLQAGAVLASPCLAQETLLIATLGGTISAMCVKSGSTLWTTTGSKPYFASPAVIGDEHSVFGDVSGFVSCFKNSSGIKIWSYQTTGNLFSSFCVNTNEAGRQVVLFGCSDGKVYCLNDSGFLIWMCQLSARVTSTLCVFPSKKHQNEVEQIVAIVSDPKTLTFLNFHTGSFIQTFELPFQTFSSPIVIKSFVIFGCRDNYLYCFQIK